MNSIHYRIDILARAISERKTLTDEISDSSEGRWASLIASLAPTALNLVGNLLGNSGGGGGGGNCKMIFFVLASNTDSIDCAAQPQPTGPQQIVST